MAALAPRSAIDFGMVVRIPMIEITTIGAGGGSIAWVDRSGLPQVGPESAGAEPGPVCRGLERLGRLDAAASRAAIRAHVGGPPGLGDAEAAEAILKLATAKMAGAIRLVSIEKGHDPSQFAAMPLGGDMRALGPAMTCAQARAAIAPG